MTKLWALLFLGVVAAGPVAASVVPDCAGSTEIARAHIVRTERDGVLVLRDGRAVRLEGIRLPKGRTDRAAQSIADQALSALGQLADDRDLTLTAVPPKEDRYDRIRAQAFVGTDWIQLSLLKRGLARVNIAPDRIDCAAELYDAEGQARSARLGLWALPAYAIRTPDKTSADAGTFQIVQGRVLTADQSNGRVTLDFGPAQKGDFTVTVSPDDLANFRMIGVDPRGYAGKTLRVRGIVENSAGGPMMELANPMQVEVLQ